MAESQTNDASSIATADKPLNTPTTPKIYSSPPVSPGNVADLLKPAEQKPETEEKKAEQPISHTLPALPSEELSGDRLMMADALANQPDLAKEMSARAELADLEKTQRMDYWVEEYVKGNVSIPQTDTGIKLYMLNAVLQGMNEDNRLDVWKEFEHSQLTPDQRKELGKVMSAVHHTKGIKVATEEHQKTYEHEEGTPKQEGKTHDRVIPPEAFDRLWNGTIAGTKHELVKLAFFTETGTTSTPADITSAEEDEKIAEFLKNPAYEKQIQEFTNMVAEGVKLLESPEGKKLTFAYRKALDYSYVPDQILYAQHPSELGYTEANAEFAQLEQDYNEKREHHPLQQAQGKPREDIVSYLRDHLGKAYPDFNKTESFGWSFLMYMIQ